MMATHAEKDIVCWQAWKAKPTGENLHTLLKQVSPVIYTAVRANQGTLSPQTVMAEAQVQAVGAFHSYNPKMGVKLSTHVTNALQKVNRLNYKYQEIFEVPEQRRIKYKAYTNAKAHFEDTMGRSPSMEELAHELKWSKAEVTRFNQEARTEFSDTQPYSSDLAQHKTTDETMSAYIYHDLTPQQQVIFEHTTGYGGQAILSNPQIMKKVGLTQGQLSYAKKQLTDVIKKAQGIYISG